MPDADEPVAANIQYGGAYRNELKAAEEKNACPFCADRETDAVLYRTTGWFIKELPEKWRAKSYWPKDAPVEIPAAQSFLIVAERHVTQASHMSDNDWLGVARVFSWATSRFRIQGGGLCLRFGDPELCGRTIMHLHFHLVVPPRHPETGKVLPLPFWIG